MRGDGLHNIYLKCAFTSDSLGSRSFATCYGISVAFRGIPWHSGLQLGESDVSTQRKADLHNETQMPESLRPEFLNSEVCKL